MSIRQIIIADDLTGALDGAAAWGPYCRTRVFLDSDAGSTAGTEVVAIDTNTRHRAPEEAAAVVAKETANARQLSSSAARYKKIDSILRGNTAVEIAAAFHAFSSEVLNASAMIAPAFPEMGRTVFGGVVRVDHQPLPDRAGNLSEQLRAAGLRVALIDLAVVRRGGADIRRVYETYLAQGAEAIVIDAETGADLSSIDEAYAGLKKPTLLVGSAGLLRVAAQRAISNASPTNCQTKPVSGHSVIVVGSYSEQARAQCASLRASGVASVMLSPPFTEDRQQAAACDLTRHLTDSDALLCPNPKIVVEPDRAAAITTALAATIRRVLATRCPSTKPTALILSGGETARAVLKAAGVDSLDVSGEIEPGVVRSSAGDRLGGLTIVTKAGAFGDTGTLERIRHAVMQSPRQRCSESDISPAKRGCQRQGSQRR